MAKKFKFKLATLLRMRHFAKEKSLVELAKVNKQIIHNKNEILNLKKSLGTLIDEQNYHLKLNSSARNISFFPMYSESVQIKIELLENEIIELEKLFEIRKNEMIQRKNEYDIIDKLKMKEENEFRKISNKESEIERQDYIIMNLKKEGD